MPDIVNPYIAGNPVSGTEMFFGRDDVFKFVQQALTGQHRDNAIVLYGQRRTGKTSVLYQMHRHLDQRYLCIFIDLHGLALDGLNGFLWELANTITRSLKKDYGIEVSRPISRTDFFADSRSAFENDFLNQVWSAIGQRHVLLMIDEAIRLQEQIQSGKLGKEVFEYLRHLMQHHERLNFLFSLGSGLEEMEQEYAFLFNASLYKRISFLEHEAALALITQPVQGYYQVEPAAIERILQITSGHAYYTQLLCHSLFNRWQQTKQAQITASDVDAILDEVVERGLAVLKHVWEESTPGEKAVLAGLATAMRDRNRSIELRVINRIWSQHDVTLPENELSKAIKNLITRDVIAGRDKYEFTIDLQRQWVQNYERLDWVKEEIAADIQRWKTITIVSPLRSLWRNLLLGVVGLVIAVFILLVSRLMIQGQEFEKLSQTATESARGGQATLESYNGQLATAERIRLQAANAPAATQTAAAEQVNLIAVQATYAAQSLNSTATTAAKFFQGNLSSQSQTDTLQPQLSPTPCVNNSRFLVDVTVPDGTRFNPGTPFTKTWRLQNTGTCIWAENYQLHLINGDQMGSLTYVNMPHTVNPGEAVDISSSFIAPVSAGDYRRGQWQLRDPNGISFGASPYVIIRVITGSDLITATPTPNLITISSQSMNLLKYAPSATWTNGISTGLWMQSYPSDGDKNTLHGFAVYVPKGRLLEIGEEVQNDNQVVETHPKYGPNGEIRGSFLITLPPQGAVLSYTLVFLAGASQTPEADGVTVEVYWCDSQRGSVPCAQIRQTYENDNGRESTHVDDLQPYAGQTGELRLVVNARSNSFNDWLVWTALRIMPK